MPELPEVDSARRFVQNLCAGHLITKVVAVEQGGGPRHGLFDDIVFAEGSSEISICKALKGQTLTTVNRKGKQMWFEFCDASSPAVLFHFGMTGSFSVKDHDIPTYKSFRVDAQQWPPRFTKLLIEFSNGMEVAFSDSRRLGRIRIRQDPTNSPPISLLGTDPINDDIPSAAAILRMLNSISAPIKSVLLDQERLFCGIGNYLADEILYQSRIHPATKACALTEIHITSMVAAMKSILTKAVAVNAEYKDFPPDWLFHVRWDKAKSKSQKIRMPDGSAVVFEEVAGRTTAIVPSLQVLHRAVTTSSTITSTSTGSSSRSGNSHKSSSGDMKEKNTLAGAMVSKKSSSFCTSSSSSSAVNVASNTASSASPPSAATTRRSSRRKVTTSVVCAETKAESGNQVSEEGSKGSGSTGKVGSKRKRSGKVVKIEVEEVAVEQRP